MVRGSTVQAVGAFNIIMGRVNGRVGGLCIRNRLYTKDGVPSHEQTVSLLVTTTLIIVPARFTWSNVS